jgi:hypothetical protein
MSGYDPSDEHRPVLWLHGHPVYAAHFLTLIFVVTMLASTILMATNAPWVLDRLTFRSDAVLRGEVWRVVTYGFVNPPSLWFAVEMLMLAWFGREVERHFGRRIFLQLYAGLYFLPPLLLTLLGLAWPTALAGEAGAFGLFIAFATLHPDAPFFFTLLAKWVAAILVGIYTLIALSTHDWAQLLSLWATTGFAYAMVRHEQGHFSWPRFGRSGRTEENVRPVAIVKPRVDAVSADIDALLDKIAASGIGSLTARERAQLDAARDRLRRREGGRR